MPVVEIAIDVRYRREGDRYVEVCASCGVDRGDREHCPCGQAFARLARGFFVTRWEPARIAVKLPAGCPHCGGATTRSIAIWDQRFTAMKGVGGGVETYQKIEVPVCARVRQPIWMYLAQVAATTLTVMFLLLAVFAAGATATIVGGALTALFAYATYRAWRARGWIRFVGFDHRSYRFAVRDAAYARRLAELNGGRVC